MSLFREPECFKKVVDLFANYVSGLSVDVIVGLESRGFIIGAAIAYKLGLPFVPVRKKGKLPGTHFILKLNYWNLINILKWIELKERLFRTVMISNMAK